MSVSIRPSDVLRLRGQHQSLVEQPRLRRRDVDA